jgi:hypothetical protein
MASARFYASYISKVSRFCEQPKLILFIIDLKTFDCFLNGGPSVRSLYNSHKCIGGRSTPEYANS